MPNQSEATTPARATRNRRAILAEPVDDPEHLVRTISRPTLPRRSNENSPDVPTEDHHVAQPTRLATNLRRRMDEARRSGDSASPPIAPATTTVETPPDNVNEEEITPVVTSPPHESVPDLPTYVENREVDPSDSLLDDLRNHRRTAEDLAAHTSMISVLQDDVDRLQEQMPQLVHNQVEQTFTDAIRSGEFSQQISDIMMQPGELNSALMDTINQTCTETARRIATTQPNLDDVQFTAARIARDVAANEINKQVPTIVCSTLESLINGSIESTFSDHLRFQVQQIAQTVYDVNTTKYQAGLRCCTDEPMNPRSTTAHVRTPVPSIPLPDDISYNDAKRATVTDNAGPTAQGNGSDPSSSESSSNDSNVSSKSRRRKERDRKSMASSAHSLSTEEDRYGGLTKDDIIKPTHREYLHALNFRTYRLVRRSQTYTDRDAQLFPGWRRKMVQEMEPHTFNGDYSIRILDFLDAFSRACDSMGVHEGAAVFLFVHFMDDNPKEDLKSRVKSMKRRKNVFSHLLSYCEIVNYLLETYADDQTISRAHTEVIRLQQLRGQNPMKFRNHIWGRALRCGCVYSQRALIYVFIEGCNSRIRNLVRRYHSDNPDITLTKLEEAARDFDIQTGGQFTYDDSDANRRRRKKNRDTPHQTLSAQATPLLASDASHSSMTSQPVRPTPPPRAHHVTAPQVNVIAPAPQVTFAQTPQSVHPRTPQQRPPPAPPLDMLGTAGMDSVPVCRICYAPVTMHVTSECPVVASAASKEDFIRTRNTNYQNAVKAGLFNRPPTDPRNRPPPSRPQPAPVAHVNSQTQAPPPNEGLTPNLRPNLKN